jgi:D-methionine transport system substrate-binding protein
MKKLLNFILIILLSFATVELASCSTSGFETAEKGTQANPVRFGVVGVSDAQWDILKQDLQKEGIYVQYLDFTDYNVGLTALQEGSLDINQSVHVFLLSTFNVKRNANLVAIGSKAVFPLGLYPNQSKGITSVADFQKGDTILIPDNNSDTSRALLELQDAGLIKLKDGGSPLSTPAEIVENESIVTVKTADASMVGRQLDDPQVTAIITNNDHIRAVGISPSESILELNLSGDVAKYYTNIFAVQNKDKDNDVYRRIVEIATHDQRWHDEILLESGYTATLTTDITSDELRTIQASVENIIRQAS